MNEKQLQFKMVLSFSRHRPEEKGLLWSTRNQTFSAKDGMTQKGMGMVAGVSDLIYFNDFFLGLEVKAKGRRHKSSHIRRQLDWGIKITERGGLWCIVTSVDGMWAAMSSNIHHPDVYNVKDVEKLLTTGKKTIIF